MEKPHVKYGSKHYFHAVSLLRDVLKNHENQYVVLKETMTLWEIGKKSLSRNGFWAMYEQILLARMLDENREIRKEAFKEIKVATKYEADRKKKNPNCLPRKFEVFRKV